MALEYKDEETKKQAELAMEKKENDAKYKKYTLEELLDLLKNNSIICGKNSEFIFKWDFDKNLVMKRNADASWQESFLSFNDFITDEYMIIENPEQTIKSFWNDKGCGTFIEVNISNKTLKYNSNRGDNIIHITDIGFYLTCDININGVESQTGTVEFDTEIFNLDVIKELQKMFNTYNKLNA